MSRPEDDYYARLLIQAAANHAKEVKELKEDVRIYRAQVRQMDEAAAGLRQALSEAKDARKVAERDLETVLENVDRIRVALQEVADRTSTATPIRPTGGLTAMEELRAPAFQPERAKAQVRDYVGENTVAPSCQCGAVVNGWMVRAAHMEYCSMFQKEGV